MSAAEIAGALAGAIVVGLIVQRLAFAILRRSTRRSEGAGGRSLVAHLDAPSRVIVPLVALDLAAGSLSIPDPAGAVLVRATSICLVAALAWLVVCSTYVFDDVFLAHHQLDATDNLRSRRLHTQVQVLRRVAVVIVTVVAVAIILLSFPQVRAAGAGLLASAGLVGLVAGVAARPAVTNVIAGLQIALSQPIRVDDVVVVNGEWGRIEEIALTYVVVKVWDLRRLVVPVSYFIEQPFENWTRSTADILGWVFLEVDYAAPVAAIRAAFEEIVAASPDWDGKVRVLQVTNLGSETMQLRALMSAANSSRSWNLQCEVREQLIRYVQEHHPDALPHLRTAVRPGGGPPAGFGNGSGTERAGAEGSRAEGADAAC